MIQFLPVLLALLLNGPIGPMSDDFGSLRLAESASNSRFLKNEQSPAGEFQRMAIVLALQVIKESRDSNIEVCFAEDEPQSPAVRIISRTSARINPGFARSVRSRDGPKI
ncbi:MAG: hypothetical protein J0L72_00105 [Armatimonadetes bacterium]|nr:hypothetical protein [Armatimonadota bacterium]